jgi:hypothetical protein
MEKICEVVIDVNANEYIRGRISGITYVLTGMPEQTFGWRQREEGSDYDWFFVATQEQYQTIIDTIEKLYPGVIKYEKMKKEVAKEEVPV